MSKFYCASDYQGFYIGDFRVYGGYEYGGQMGLENDDDETIWGFYVTDSFGNVISHRPMTEQEQGSLESGDMVSLGYFLELVDQGVFKITRE
jgi:hypothetical protein